MEKAKFVTDTISMGETKFMVRQLKLELCALFAFQCFSTDNW